MSSITIQSIDSLPVLSAITRFKHVELPPGDYELREISHPFPDSGKKGDAPQNWLVTEFQGEVVGMTIMAWITLNIGGIPMIRTIRVDGYASISIKEE